MADIDQRQLARFRDALTAWVREGLRSPARPWCAAFDELWPAPRPREEWYDLALHVYDWCARQIDAEGTDEILAVVVSLASSDSKSFRHRAPRTEQEARRQISRAAPPSVYLMDPKAWLAFQGEEEYRYPLPAFLPGESGSTDDLDNPMRTAFYREWRSPDCREDGLYRAVYMIRTRSSETPTRS